MEKTKILISQLSNALSRLIEVLDLKKTEIVRDSAIQRFEFTLDLSWKLIKSFLEEQSGVVCSSPKECFREAYHNKLIAYEEKYLELVDIRNLTTHSYNEKLAEEIYKELPRAHELLFILLGNIQKQVK